MDRQIIWGVVATLSIYVASVAHAGDAPPSSTAVGSAIPDKVTVGIDAHHPPKIGADFYPKESLRNKEQGTALIRLYSDSDGSIPATQIVVSSGFPRLDVASLVAWVDAGTSPAILHGQPISKWINVPTGWKLNGGSLVKREFDPSVTPQMQDDYRPEIGRPFYPKAALEMRLEGTCLVHFKVSEGGTSSDISISKSTGHATLDQACVTAIQNAQFTAAKLDGKFVAAWTDIFINWKLPPQ